MTLHHRLTSPVNRASLDYWTAKCRARWLPGRSDIDPLEMWDFLLNIVLLDVLTDPLDFRYRLIGGIVRYHLNTNLQGRSMRQISYQAPPSIIFGSCQHVVETRDPLSSEIPYVGPHSDYRAADDLILPLASDGWMGDMLLVTIDYFVPREQPESR